jgi:hypothetical protein
MNYSKLFAGTLLVSPVCCMQVTKKKNNYGQTAVFYATSADGHELITTEWV